MRTNVREGQEEQGRVPLDVGVHERDVISCAVNHAKNNVLVGHLNLLGQFLVDGGKLFAVAAPGSMNKQNCVFLDTMNLGVVVVGDDDLDRSGVVFRDWLRFGVR